MLTHLYVAKQVKDTLAEIEQIATQNAVSPQAAPQMIRDQEKRSRAVNGKPQEFFNAPEKLRYYSYKGQVQIFRSPDLVRRPADEFEARYGMHGIAQSYTMPGDLSAGDIEQCITIMRDLAGIDPAWKARMNKLVPQIARSLIALNPALDDIACSFLSHSQPFDLVHGVTSGFNAADIKDFIEIGNGRAKRDDSYEELSGKVRARTPMLGWVPSMSTLAKIDRQPVSAPKAKAPVKTASPAPRP